MRIEPLPKYHMLPCSFVGVGCAFEDIYKADFPGVLSEELKEDGWLNLDDANRYIREYLPVKKKQYFKRNERSKLSLFLRDNTRKCCVCVYGHFIYVNGHDYWSYFDNEDDDIVCIWYLEEEKEEI